jgi:hypothetical protein
MTDRTAIIAAYEECEAAARRIVPGRMLLTEDCLICAEMAAEECGVSFEEARAVLIEHWVTPAN